MDKALFKEYEKWCVENNKDPLKEETVSEFNSLLEKQKEEKELNNESEKNEELVKQQQEIWNLICKYVGAKAKYDEDYMFEVLDAKFKSFVLAAIACNKEKELRKILDKVLG